MLDGGMQYQIDQLRREDMLRNAEKSLRARDLKAAANRKPEFYAPALARMGQTLAKVGNALQERYGPLQEQPTRRGDYRLGTA